MKRVSELRFDPKERAAQKVAARSQDAKRLASGVDSARSLNRRNGFLAAADLSKVIILGPRRAHAAA